jgi:hypothetical protein
MLTVRSGKLHPRLRSSDFSRQLPTYSDLKFLYTRDNDDKGVASPYYTALIVRLDVLRPEIVKPAWLGLWRQ